MTKVIKMTDLIDLLYRARPIFGHYFESFMNEVSQLPVEDIKPVKYAQWIDHKEDGYVECPICGSCTNCEYDESIDDLNYCFSCGSRLGTMNIRGKKNDKQRIHG